jgi:hypothetical protein
MQIIKHRINTIAQLDEVDPSWGVEIDLRADSKRPGRLYLHHDAWQAGPDFVSWLRAFTQRKIRGPIILNTKEDGLEEAVLGLLKQHKAKHYFFLDTAFPTLVRWTLRNKKRSFALRYSRFEHAANLAPFRGKADWLWVDCFDGKPVAAAPLRKLKRYFKICLVSPELQGAPAENLSKFKALQSLADAVCTKRPDLWDLTATQLR